MAKKKSKNVVICLDGTGNQFNEDNSNVVKLFRVLRREAGAQVAYYDPGVGTLADPGYKSSVAKKINMGLGLAFGRGLTRNVEEAYSYLMDHYEEGDRIYLFGFSRGAFTARALAGFIQHCGLLEKGCQNLIPYALRLFKSKKVDFPLAARFKQTYARTCPIHFVGLWDTVSTYGWVYDPIYLPFTTNNKGVKAARHALAIDEKRVFFRPSLLGEFGDKKEVWFAGVHSDVGGGYPESESGLAKIPLQWMVEEARDRFDLLIDDERYQQYVFGNKRREYVAPDPLGPQHESLKGPWWVAELFPIRRRIWEGGVEKREWHMPRPSSRRAIKEGSTIHSSVLDRMAAGGYSPPNLPDPGEIRSRFEIEA